MDAVQPRSFITAACIFVRDWNGGGDFCKADCTGLGAARPANPYDKSQGGEDSAGNHAPCVTHRSQLQSSLLTPLGCVPSKSITFLRLPSWLPGPRHHQQFPDSGIFIKTRRKGRSPPCTSQVSALPGRGKGRAKALSSMGLRGLEEQEGS